MSLGITQSCLNCSVSFSVCSKCWRGQKFCSESCRAEKRKYQTKSAGLRYRKSAKGKANHLKRQNRYRKRLKSKKVTHQSSANLTKKLKPLPSVPLPQGTCYRCGKRISFIVQMKDLIAMSLRPFLKDKKYDRSRNPCRD